MIGKLFTPEKLKTVLEHKLLELAIMFGAFLLVSFLRRR